VALLLLRLLRLLLRLLLCGVWVVGGKKKRWCGGQNDDGEEEAHKIQGANHAARL
jgi:hypothetical protein